MYKININIKSDNNNEIVINFLNENIDFIKDNIDFFNDNIDFIKDNIDYIKDNIDYIKDNTDFIKNNNKNIKNILKIIKVNNNYKSRKTNYYKNNLKCKYGTLCCNNNCKNLHPIGWNPEDARKRLSKVSCKFGNNCNNIKACLYFHKENSSNNYEKKCVSITATTIKPINPLINNNNRNIDNIDNDINNISNFCNNQNKKYISMKVIYIANGWGHNDRIPCWIILVDFNGNIIFNEKINPILSKNLFEITSTLEIITGITTDILEKEGKSYSEVINNIEKILNSDTILIGHNIDVDILRLGLKCNKHYKSYIDLSLEFRTAKLYGQKVKHKYYSIDEQKFALLNIKENNKNIINDTKYIMILFKNWIHPGNTKKNRAIKKLVECKYPLNNDNNFIINGVCCATYRRDKCICNDK